MGDSDEVRALLARLKDDGERLTQQRKQVLAALQDTGSHMTVEEARAYLSDRGFAFDAPTIYRVLQWLKRVGIVSQTDLGGEAIVYQVVTQHRHHHLVCLSCGAIEDVPDAMLAGLRRKLRDEHGFEPRIDHLAIFGVCRRCRK
jgi:Fur family ferric uptake transcriptional regulator